MKSSRAPPVPTASPVQPVRNTFTGTRLLASVTSITRDDPVPTSVTRPASPSAAIAGMRGATPSRLPTLMVALRLAAVADEAAAIPLATSRRSGRRSFKSASIRRFSCARPSARAASLRASANSACSARLVSATPI